MRRRWPRRILIAVNVIVAVGILGTVGAYAYVHSKLGDIHKVKVAGLAKSSGPFTLLIVGSDSRSALSGPGNAQYGSAASTPGQRSDTIMLARIVPAQHTLTLMSIPRDLFVNIKGIGQSRINAAFNNGPNLLISTIESDLGIPINHYVEVNFDSFKDITDAVGGVKFYFPTPVRDVYSNLSIPQAGCVNLTGNQALGFARSRHYEYEVNGQWITQGLSDLARIQRQQAFVKKMIKKAESKFSNPLALNGIIDSVTKNLTVDSGFGTGLMVSLAEDLRDADVAGIPTETLPTTPVVIGGADVLQLDPSSAHQMITAFNNLGTSRSSSSSTKQKSTTSTTVSPSKVAVQVANGSGVTGQAAKAATALKKLGYKATVTSSSPGSGFTGNEIVYAPDSLAAAQQLAKKLAGSATLTAAASLASSPYNLELITGSNYAGLASAHRPSTTKTTAASTTTTTYLLPGPQPTAAELAAC
jgi:LCP family protein required for cell wall assembly